MISVAKSCLNQWIVLKSNGLLHSECWFCLLPAFWVLINDSWALVILSLPECNNIWQHHRAWGQEIGIYSLK